MMPPCASAKMLGWPVREGHGKAVNLQQIVVRRRMADSPKTDPSVLPTQAAQGIWLEVLAQSLMAEAGFALDFVAQTAQQVAARLQVMCGLSGHPWHQVVVEVHLVGGRYSPELSASIIVIRQGNLPGVFIDEEGALLIDVALARFELTFNLPDPMPLVTYIAAVDVGGLDDLSVFQAFVVQVVIVVGVDSENGI